MIDLDILQKAIILTQQGNFNDAEKIYFELEEKHTDNAMFLSAFGLFYISKRDYEKATYYLEKACSIEESFGTVSALGFAKYEQKNFKEAALVLEHSLNFGENADVYNKLVHSLFQIKNYGKAIQYTELMCEKYPNNENSIINKIKALTQTGKLREAEELCVNKLKENNNNAALWMQLGYLKELIYCNDRQACECFKIVLELGHKEALYTIATSLYKQGDYENSEIYYKKMLENFPNSNDTKIGLGLLYLKQKRFREGYELLLQTERIPLQKFSKNNFNIGDKLEKEVVILCDQGFGDHIQHIRYIPLLQKKVEKIQVCAHKSLKELFKKNYPEIDFISPNEINPETQSIKITNLPYVLDLDFNNIPFKDGYLESEELTIKSKNLKIGLCWEAGSSGIRTMINRTINIKTFEPILNLKTADIYSFQVDDSFNGNEQYPQMINLAKDFNDFSDTAKALKAMDLVITVDTSVAHLAGALGIKTFLLLPYASDWRWFEDNKTTPWYKSVEIFKQTDPVSWNNEINDILEKLN